MIKDVPFSKQESVFDIESAISKTARPIVEIDRVKPLYTIKLLLKTDTHKKKKKQYYYCVKYLITNSYVHFC